jgi:5,10-methylenetetrahydromethanopterin reductase
MFEGHMTHLTERDRLLLPHMDCSTMVGSPASIGEELKSLAAAGFREAIYTPSGPDVPRELKAFARVPLGWRD